jgi:hypothetical protein
MTADFPIVIETEATGVVSAFVPGLPVYAAAYIRAQAQRAIRSTLAAYLAAHSPTEASARVRVARVSDQATPRARLALVGVCAFMGSDRSPRKARTSAHNGRLGGQPRTRAWLRTNDHDYLVLRAAQHAGRVP